MIVSLTIEGSDQLVILSPCCCGNNNKGRTINKTEIFRTQTAGYLKSSTCNLTLGLAAVLVFYNVQPGAAAD